MTGIPRKLLLEATGIELDDDAGAGCGHDVSAAG